MRQLGTQLKDGQLTIRGVKSSHLDAEYIGTARSRSEDGNGIIRLVNRQGHDPRSPSK